MKRRTLKKRRAAWLRARLLETKRLSDRHDRASRSAAARQFAEALSSDMFDMGRVRKAFAGLAMRLLARDYASGYVGRSLPVEWHSAEASGTVKPLGAWSMVVDEFESGDDG